RNIGVHIKVDTGMGRLGFKDDAQKEILEIANLKGITIDGVMSHFSEADLADASFAKMQLERFRDLRNGLVSHGLKIGMFHLSNSAAVMTLPESHLDGVRPGLMLYGYSPVQKSEAELRTLNSELIPVMTVKARILALRKLVSGTPVSYGRTFITKRDSLIGVITAGYADGFNRLFSNNAEVLVKGRRVQVAGRVCMDLTMIDLTEVRDVTEGDEVIIIGRQGDELIDASELALRADTIPYEIVISLGCRAKRIYRDNN
ncbi:MAG: alanine racemase, partial [Nitrospirae bacterium]|nr:alanine racemase [Nitrospirota bacterium]